MMIIMELKENASLYLKFLFSYFLRLECRTAQIQEECNSITYLVLCLFTYVLQSGCIYLIQYRSFWMLYYLIPKVRFQHLFQFPFMKWLYSLKYLIL